MFRKLLSALVILSVLLSVGLTVVAEKNVATSENIGKQNYSCYADTVKSYLVSSEDGMLMRVEAIGQQVVLEKYNSDLKLIQSLSISFELPLFGGFYESGDSYFLVFGQENLKEDDSAEVIRVIRYDKDWQRIGAASLYGANTRTPFAFGSLRMTHSGDYLFIRTCHEKYREIDGYCPQSSLMLAVRISSMKITDATFSETDPGYVSRSFNQFVSTDQDFLLSVDQGVDFPRAAVLSRCALRQPDGLFPKSWESVNVFPFSGKNGNSNTGACIGGFAASNSSYIVAGNSTRGGSDSGVRDIFVTATPKNAFSEKGTELNWITNYPVRDPSYADSVSAPQIVAIDDGFLLLWMAKGKLNYVVLNQNGERNGTIWTAEADLSDCNPIYMGDRVYWYTTNHSAPIFYCIDMTSPETVNTVITPEESDPTETSETEQPTEPTEIDLHDECPSKNFLDVPGEGHWAHQGIDFAIQNNLFNGVSATSFKPDAPMTRAMLVTVLWRASGMPEQGMNPFLDVPDNAWYTDAVQWASACNIVNGVGTGRFCPEGNTTREQIATILYRFADYNNKNTTERSDLSKFADSRRVSSWAVDAMQWAVAKGIISGSGKNDTLMLLPRESATRAQVATILMRYLQDE